MKNVFIFVILFLTGIYLLNCHKRNNPYKDRRSCVQRWKKKNLHPVKDYHPGYILISFNDNVDKKTADKLLKSYQFTNIKYIYERPLLSIVRVPDGKEFDSICKLQNETHIEVVEPDYNIQID